MKNLIAVLSLVLVALGCSRPSFTHVHTTIGFAIVDHTAPPVVHQTATFEVGGSSHTPAEKVVVLTPVKLFLTSEASLTVDHLGYPAVSVTIDKGDAAKFSAFTAANVNQEMAIIVDGKVWSQATIHERLPGQFQLYGHFSEADAKALLATLKK